MPTASEKAKAKYQAMLEQSKINNSSRKYHLFAVTLCRVLFSASSHSLICFFPLLLQDIQSIKR